MGTPCVGLAQYPSTCIFTAAMDPTAAQRAYRWDERKGRQKGRPRGSPISTHPISGGPTPRLLRRLTCGTSPDDGVLGHGGTPPRLGTSSGPAIASNPLRGATRTPAEPGHAPCQGLSPGRPCRSRGRCRLLTHATAQLRHPRQQRGGKASHPCHVYLYPSAHAGSIHPPRACPETSPDFFTKPLKTQAPKNTKTWKQFRTGSNAPR